MARNKKGQGSVFLRGLTWSYSYYRAGVKITRSSGSTKKTVALRMHQQELGDLASGRLPTRDFEKTVWEDLVECLKTDIKLNERGEPRLKHLDAYFWGRRALDITTNRIKQYVLQRQKAGAQNGTINRELATLRRAFRLASEESPPLIDFIPKVPMLREAKPRAGYIAKKDELVALLPEYLQSAARFAYSTGWRKSEILGLKWSCVDMEAGKITLPTGSTKNGRGRILLMNDEDMALLREQISKRRLGFPYVFHRDGERIQDFRFAWNVACRELGLGYGYKLNNEYVEKWKKKGLKWGPVLHNMRRTMATDADEAGLSRDQIKRRGGWVTDSMFSRYNIGTDEGDRDAAQRLLEYRRLKAQNSD